MTKFTLAGILASTFVAGGLMAGASHAASAVIVPNGTSIGCGSGAANAACTDKQESQGGSAVKSLAGTGDDDLGGGNDDDHNGHNDDHNDGHDDGGNESGHDGDND